MIDRFAKLTMAAASAGLFLALAAPVLSQDKKGDLPKAEALLNKYVEATGGKAAYAKIKSTSGKGTMSFMGIKGKINLYQKQPDKMLMEIELAGIGKITQGYNGKIAWEVNPITGAKIHKGAKAEEFRRMASLNSDVQWKKFYKNVKTVKIVDVNGKPAYQVNLTSTTGEVHSRYYDKKSGLVVRMKMKVDSDQGKLEVTSDVLEYKAFGGVKFATKLRQSVLGQQIDMTVDNIEVNVEIPDSRFALPKQVKDLLKDV